jgi:hypothetical protein
MSDIYLVLVRDSKRYLFEHEREHWCCPDRGSKIADDDIPKIPVHLGISVVLGDIAIKSAVLETGTSCRCRGGKVVAAPARQQPLQVEGRSLAERLSMTRKPPIGAFPAEIE